MPETGFETRCVGYEVSSNGFLDFSAASNPMLPPTKASVIWDNQQREGNDAFSCMPMQATMDSSSSTFDFQASVPPDEPMQLEFPGFPGLSDNASWNQGYPMPVNDPLSLNHAGSYPLFS